MKYVLVAFLLAAIGLFFGPDQVQADDRGVGYSVSIPGPIGYPPTVVFIGTFYTLDQKKEASSISTIKVLINKKEWLFKIKKAFDLTGNMTELDMINMIWPGTLTIKGITKDSIAPLEKTDIKGKKFSIYGDFYYVEKWLRVESVRELEKKKD